MRKLLVCLVASAFVLGCGKSLDQEINAELEKYNDACAEVAFKDTRAKLAEADALKAEGRSDDANVLLKEAKTIFDNDVIAYNDALKNIDKLKADMEDQKSRLANLKKQVDAEKRLQKEYAKSEKTINNLQANAAEKIIYCDVAAASVAVENAENELRSIEAAVTGKAVVRSDEYTVKKGDCLWKIAANKYANPYFWPLIYWSNKSSIKDPDLIYPKQVLKIDQGYDANKKAEAEKFAKTRGAWSLYDGK